MSPVHYALCSMQIYPAPPSDWRQPGGQHLAPCNFFHFSDFSDFSTLLTLDFSTFFLCVHCVLLCVHCVKPLFSFRNQKSLLSEINLRYACMMQITNTIAKNTVIMPLLFKPVTLSCWSEAEIPVHRGRRVRLAKRLTSLSTVYASTRPNGLGRAGKLSMTV